MNDKPVSLPQGFGEHVMHWYCWLGLLVLWIAVASDVWGDPQGGP